MLSTEATEKEEAAAVAKQKATAVATGNSIRQKMALQLEQKRRAEKRVRKETVEERAERMRQSLIQSLW